jgi:hypothetical protein
MGRINHDLLMAGSVPLGRVEQVLEIIPNPGAASGCGFGRLAPAMLDDHLCALEALRA